MHYRLVVLAALAVITESASLYSRHTVGPPYTPCGRHSVGWEECEEGYECIADPRRKSDCGNECYPGLCITKDTSIMTRCGGVAGRKCPRGKQCYDFKFDGCDAKKNPDCLGICLVRLYDSD